MPDEIGMQRHAHDDGLLPGLRQPLLEIVDDHVGEGRGRIGAGDDRGNVVHFLRIRDRQEESRLGPHPDRLVVHAPVQRIAVAGLGQQVGRRVALRDPRAQPAGRRHILRLGQDPGGLGDHRPLRRYVHPVLALAVRAAVAGDLVAPRAVGGHQLRRVFVHLGIGEDGRRQVELVEQRQQTPRADAVAVVPPGVVQDVRLRARGRQLRAQALAEREMLEVDAEIDRQPFAVGPGEVGPSGDRHVVEAAVMRKAHSGASAKPARASRISALSFQTSVRTIRPSRTAKKST